MDLSELKISCFWKFMFATVREWQTLLKDTPTQFNLTIRQYTLCARKRRIEIIPLQKSRLKIYDNMSIERRPSLVVDIFSNFFTLFNSKKANISMLYE